MADPGDSGRQASGAEVDDDALLTAYADGALGDGDRAALEARLAGDATLRQRLETLRRAERPYAAAFDVLLHTAPGERLQAMLEGLVAKHAEAGRQTAQGRRRWPRVAAAAVVFFAVGALAGWLVPQFTPPPQPGWRQVVAEYQALTTTATLAAIPDGNAAVDRDLAAIGSQLDLPLTTDRVALPEVTLKRVNLFEFRGKPLAQISYLSPGAGPIAFCIINNGRPDEATAFEVREGYNIVFWSHGGRGYMLIGKAPRDVLEAYAQGLEDRFS